MVNSNVPLPRVLGVIPARFASTRFPAKPLALLGGKPVIQHVYERALEAKSIGHIVIATDDERILNTALAFGADARMTSADHLSGTDRAAEIAVAFPHEFVVNI